MNSKIGLAALVVAALTAGTASATSLGLTDTTVFAADTVDLEPCTASNVQLNANYALATPGFQPLGWISGDFACDDSGHPLVVDIIAWIDHDDDVTTPAVSYMSHAWYYHPNQGISVEALTFGSDGAPNLTALDVERIEQLDLVFRDHGGQ